MRELRRFLRLYQSLVVSGVIILFCSIALIVGLIPGVKKSIALFQETQSLRSVIKVLQEKERILEGLDVTELATYARSAITAVPADKSLGSLFSTIDALTAREGVVVTAISLGSVGSIATESAKKLSVEEQKIGVNIIPFTIIVDGPMNQVRNVVDSAVKIRRFFRVRNFSLSFDLKTGRTNSTLAMEAYYIPDPQFMGKVTDPLTGLTEEEMGVLDAVSQIPLLTPEEPVSGIENVSPVQTSPVTLDPFSP